MVSKIKLTEAECDEFFERLPQWAKEQLFKDQYVYTVMAMVRAGTIKKEDFFENLAKLMMGRAKSFEKAYVDHMLTCTHFLTFRAAPIAPKE